MSFAQGAYNIFTSATASVQSLIKDPINWEIWSTEPEETELDRLRSYTELDPFTGDKTDYYRGVLPEAMSKAQESFSLAQLVERGAKGPLDIFKATGTLLSNQAKFHNKDLRTEPRKANGLFLRLENWVLPGEDSSLYWITEYFNKITAGFNSVDEWCRSLLHGDESPIKAIFPRLWRTGISEDEEEYLVKWSMGFEGFQSFFKTGTYNISAKKNLDSLRAAQTELDDFQKTNLRSKNIWQFIYNSGLGGDKLALMTALPFTLTEHYMIAASLVWVGRLYAEIAYFGGMLAAGGMNRDTMHTRDLRELRSAVQKVLDEANRADMGVKEAVLDRYGSEHHRFLTPLRASLVTYFGERVSLFERRNNPLRRVVARWFFGKVPAHKHIPWVKTLYEEAKPSADLLLAKTAIDKSNELMAEDDMTTASAMEALIEGLTQTLPEDSDNPYKQGLQTLIEQAGRAMQEASNTGEGGRVRDKDEEERALAEAGNVRQEILDRAQRLVGTFEEEDPHTGIKRKVLGSLHQKTIQISQLKAASQRTVLEHVWDKIPYNPRKTCPHLDMSKKERVEKIATLEAEVQAELETFRGYAARRILSIKRMTKNVSGDEITETLDSVEGLVAHMRPKQDATNLQVAQVGAANGRLFDSIPKFATTAVFLVVGAQIMYEGTVPDHKIVSTIKGALQFPWYAWTGVAFVSALGAGLTFKRALQEYQRAIAQQHQKNTWYNRIALLGESVKIPGNIMVANPVTRVPGVMIYACGCMLETFCHVSDNWELIKGSFKYYFASAPKEGGDDSQGQGQNHHQEHNQEGA